VSDIDGKPRGSGSEMGDERIERREVSRLKEAPDDTLDHFAVIEARIKSAGGRRYSTAEVKKALGI
jgi:hypothetical protein